MKITPDQNISNIQQLQIARVEFLLKCGLTSYEAAQDALVCAMSDIVIQLEAAHPQGVLNPNTGA